MDHCLHCHAILGEQRVLLDRRIEVMTFSGDMPRATVLGCDDGYAFCSQECWHKHQPTIIEQLKLTQTYPVFDVLSDCCRCGAPVDRRQAYVMYALMEATMESKPWLKSCSVQSDEEFAVLCQQCEFPNFDSAEQDTEECGPDLITAGNVVCEKTQ